MMRPTCKNKLCGEKLPLGRMNKTPFGFCPSCWVATKIGYRWGVVMAVIVGFIGKIILSYF